MVGSISQVSPISDGPQFATTHWSIVLGAGKDDLSMAQDSLEKLCRSYWYPLYGYVRRRGYSPENAEDLTQEFFQSLLERKDSATLRPEQGRFRSCLLASMQHFLTNEWHHRRRQKRGGGQPMFSLYTKPPEGQYSLEVADEATPETLYERRWVQTVLERVIERLRQEYVATDKGDLFAELKDFLSEKKARPHAGIAAKHNVSVSAIDVAVHRLRRRYGELLREVIAQTVERVEDVEAEIRHLIADLAK